MMGIRFVFAACLGTCWLLGFGQDVNPERVRGQQIYLHGSSDGKIPITATLGEDREPIPASTFPCVNCHTRNGRGKAEGGIVPSDITWDVLTKPYDLTSSTGRKRGPYTEHSLKRAITMGVDSSGNPLGAAMPHFQMSQSDLADLIAYLKTLGTNTDRRLSDPGLSENQIRIGVILPPARLTEMHKAVDAAVKAYFEEFNKQGGIFRRRIELRTIDYPEAAEQRADKILDFLATQEIFALTSSFIAGGEDQLAPIFEQKKTPLIAAFTFDPANSASPNPFVFYFNEGVSGEAKALAAFAAKRSRAADARLAIVYFKNKLSRELADTVEQSCKASGLSTPSRIALSDENGMTSEMARRIVQAGYDFVFLLAAGPELLSSLQQAGGENSQTAFLIPGSLAQSEVVNSSLARRARIFLAVSAAQRGISGDASQEYRRLVESHQLPGYRVPEQWAALAGAKILVEGLKRSGRDLDRESLIKSLEELSSFDTGFAPSLSYGPNRRTGNERVQIMEVDFKNRTFVPVN